MKRSSERLDVLVGAPDEAPASCALRRFSQPGETGPETRSFRPDGLTAAAVNAFVDALVPAGLPPIAHILLFGSRARGDFDEWSDVDVAVVMARRGGVSRMSADREIRRQTYWARADHDFAVEPVVIWQESLENPASTGEPEFYRNLARDALEWSLADGHS